MYQLVAIGGTFDRLHAGHRSFISRAFQYGKRVIIGLTSDDFRSSKRTSQNAKLQLKTQNYGERKEELEKFLKKEGLRQRVEIVKIEDVYGPAVEENAIEALVVTRDTLEGGRKVNRKRRALGLNPLKILQIPLVLAQDHRRIASTRIRLGEIDRWGRLYTFPISNFQFPITENLRQELKKPVGVLVRGNPDDLHSLVPELKKLIGKTQNSMIITVGDEVTKLCNEIDLTAHLSIFDFRVNRKLKYTSMEDLAIPRPFARGPLAKTVVTVRNPQGHITHSLISSIAQAVKGCIADEKRRFIRVLGEEDLAGIPAILLSPLGSLVLYGQPEEGVVVVEVTEERKKQLVEMIDRLGS